MTAIPPLPDRACDILSHVVEAFVETGEPVGSKTLSAKLGLQLSPATIRNVMADLERRGLLYAPHTSAGRLPTEEGLRFFVRGLLEMGQLSPDEAQSIGEHCSLNGKSYETVLSEATQTLSGLSQCAGLVLAPEAEERVQYLEFVHLANGRALVVLVLESGTVENRVIEVPEGIGSSTLQEASNYLSNRLVGRTLREAREKIRMELETHQASLDVLATSLVEKGLAVWSGDPRSKSLIVRGQAQLLQNVTVGQDIERVRRLFEALETQSTFMRLLDATHTAEGVQIFIGAENQLFELSGCSLIVAPFRNMRSEVVGAIGVVGPSRVNYGKVIPMVDYTAKVMTRLLRPS